MLPQEIIRKTRSHEKLTAEEIEFFIRGLSRGDIADIQAASFTMAVFLNGLSREETLALTLAMRDSGEKLSWKELRDKPVLFDCLLKNLIVNAIRHSTSYDKVRILLEDGRLTVCNASASRKPLDAGTLFRRFRSGEVRQKGNGLGLAIVKAICNFHNWAVEYRFEAGFHKFIIDFRSKQP